MRAAIGCMPIFIDCPVDDLYAAIFGFRGQVRPVHEVDDLPTIAASAVDDDDVADCASLRFRAAAAMLEDGGRRYPLEPSHA